MALERFRNETRPGASARTVENLEDAARAVLEAWDARRGDMEPAIERLRAMVDSGPMPRWSERVTLADVMSRIDSLSQAEYARLFGG